MRGGRPRSAHPERPRGPSGTPHRGWALADTASAATAAELIAARGRQLGWPAWTWPLMTGGVATVIALAVWESHGRTSRVTSVSARASQRTAQAVSSTREPVQVVGATRGPAEAAAGPRATAPLLRPRLFRIPAFATGLGVMVAFALGMQGFFLMLALWLQAGQHFSPLKDAI
jgi:hypothetical protein